MVKKYDGLIYSPSISSGVSIEEKHFHRHFGMFCGEVVPSDAIQMLRRDRTAQEYIIGFDKLRGKRETDPEKSNAPTRRPCSKRLATPGC